VTSLQGATVRVRAELPEAGLARWAAILFSLSVLTFLISLAAAEAFLAAASLVYFAHLLRDRPRIQFPPLKLPLALFCLTTSISVWRAANPAAGGFAVRKLALFLILLLTANLIVSGAHLIVLYRALFLESALAGLVAAAQFARQYSNVRAVHPERVYILMTSQRISGFMGHWMNFGGQQMLVFAALLAFLVLGARQSQEPSELLTANRESRVLWWAVLGVVALSIILNFTRGVWLGCFVAAVYLVGRRSPRWLWALPVVLTAGYLAAPSLVRQRLSVLRHPSSEPSLATRFEMWHVGLRMIARHPWVGVGPNNIEQVYTLYLPPGQAPIAGYHEHLHDNFLQFGAERGLPCLVAWVWLMVALLSNSRRIRRQLSRARRPTWLVDAAIAAWLAFVAEGGFEFNFGTSPVLMLFLFVAATPSAVASAGGLGLGTGG
jgi:O-antigen ligase